MAEKEENANEAPLTEAQRIEKLEKNVGTSKLVLMLVALLLIMIISVSVTAFAIFVAKGSDKDSGELVAQIETLQTEMTSLSAKLDEKEVAILGLNEQLSSLQSQMKSTDNGVMLQLMLEQEQNHQSVLDVARASIYDLSHMVPGSRTWLESYTEELDRAAEYSKARQSKLSQLVNGEKVKVKEDDGFGDF